MGGTGSLEDDVMDDPLNLDGLTFGGGDSNRGLTELQVRTYRTLLPYLFLALVSHLYPVLPPLFVVAWSRTCVIFLSNSSVLFRFLFSSLKSKSLEDEFMADMMAMESQLADAAEEEGDGTEIEKLGRFVPIFCSFCPSICTSAVIHYDNADFLLNFFRL